MSSLQTSSRAVASVDAIRNRFPALARKYEGHPVAYFDGPGGTQVPASVVERMSDYLLHHNANTHWHFPTSLETDEALDGSRRALADFLNAAGNSADVNISIAATGNAACPVQCTITFPPTSATRS